MLAEVFADTGVRKGRPSAGLRMRRFASPQRALRTEDFDSLASIASEIEDGFLLTRRYTTRKEIENSALAIYSG